MTSFLLGVAGSLLIALVLVIAGRVSIHFRGLTASLIPRLYHLDGGRVYDSKAECANLMEDEILKSNMVRILTGRGNEFQRGRMAKLLQGTIDFRGTMKILVSASDGNPDWVGFRERELAGPNSIAGTVGLRGQIKASHEYLRTVIGQTRLAEVRSYSFPHVARVVLTDYGAWLNPYPPTAPGHEAPVVRFPAGGPTYETFVHLFNNLWIEGERL